MKHNKSPVYIELWFIHKMNNAAAVSKAVDIFYMLFINIILGSQKYTIFII